MEYVTSYLITMLVLYTLEHFLKLKSNLFKRLKTKKYYMIMFPLVVVYIAIICTIDYTLLLESSTAGGITALGGFLLLINEGVK